MPLSGFELVNHADEDSNTYYSFPGPLSGGSLKYLASRDIAKGEEVSSSLLVFPAWYCWQILLAAHFAKIHTRLSALCRSCGNTTRTPIIEPTSHCWHTGLCRRKTRRSSVRRTSLALTLMHPTSQPVPTMKTTIEVRGASLICELQLDVGYGSAGDSPMLPLLIIAVLDSLPAIQQEQGRLEQLLSSLPTSEAEDAQLLQWKSELSFRERVIMDFRIKRKRALTDALGRLSEMASLWAG